jgi:hypothetical protein
MRKRVRFAIALLVAESLCAGRGLAHLEKPTTVTPRDKKPDPKQVDVLPAKPYCAILSDTSAELLHLNSYPRHFCGDLAAVMLRDPVGHTASVRSPDVSPKWPALCVR